MAQWSAFVGVTGLVLTGFLLLARLSQRVVDEVDGDGHVRGPDGRTHDDRPAGTIDDRPTVGGVHDGDPFAPNFRDEQPADPSDDRTPTPQGRGASVRGSADGAPDASTSDSTAPAPPGGRETDPRRGSEVEGSLVADAASGGPVSPARAAREGRPEQSLSSGALLANVAITQGLFGGLLAAAAWYFAIPGAALGLSGGRVVGPLALAVGVGFGVALWVGNEVASALADAAGATYDEGLRALLAPSDQRGWLLLLGGTLPIIAVVEEFLFRGAAIGATSAGFGVSPWALAVVSSAGFALGHGAQGRVGVAVTGALGFALAAGYVLTGSLLVVVVAHYLVNALEFVLHEGVGLSDPVWSSPDEAGRGG